MKRSIAKFLFYIHGWKLVGPPIPNEVYRCMFIFAPHTSNWDFYYGVVAMMSWGIPVKIVIKNFWTKFPFSLVVGPLGGIGIDRSKKRNKENSQTNDLAPVFDKYEKIAFIITPEGSRSLKKEWKTGFYQIAKLANVPMVTLKGNYKARTVEFGPVYYPSQDLEEVMRSMMAYYNDSVAKYPSKFSLDQRYI